ncbi:MAG: hypothetical protein D6784_09700 [Chloroflexi bacterium]|nr:MAG: hypothetical protein D6784_09700 [Chloroflexota bacterium]
MKQTSRLLILLIILLAFWLRLYHLPDLPPGLNFDEAGNGAAALDILRDGPRLWWRIGGGKEPLWPYIIALTTTVLGNIPLALRLPAALAGTLTVAAVYPLTVRLVRQSGLRQARAAGLLAATGVAVSAWHLHFSRLGFRAILLPLLASLAAYFFLRGLKTWPARRSFVLAAGFTALAVYTYLAARLFPLVPLIYLLVLFLRNPNRAAARLRAAQAAAYLGLTVLFLLPLVIYFARYPADLLARSAAVSIFNPAWNQGDLPAAVWRTLRLTLSTFAGLRGDANPLVNLPGEPAIPWWLAPFFILGLVDTLGRGLSRQGQTTPLLLLPIWWVVMLLPAILAPEGAPHHLRLIGTLGPTYILLAWGMVRLTGWLGRPARLAPAGRVLPALPYLILAALTFNSYFVRWPASTDFTLPFDLYAVRLASEIAAAPPETVYILPMDIRAGPEARHYTLDYLLANQQPRRYHYLPVDEANAQAVLRQAAASAQQLRVVRWTADKHIEADARELVAFLLATNARLVDRQAFPVYNIETYRPLAGATFTLPDIDRPAHTVFEDRLRLEAVYLPASAAPGTVLPVAVRLFPLAKMTADYKASLRLVDPSGARVAQKDRVLLHPYHQGASLWPPEAVNEYYLLDIPPDAPAGNYTVTLVIYHPDTLAPLVAGGQAEIPLGQVRID